MVSQKGNAPIFEDKEGNVRLSIFKNKTKTGKKYPIVAVTIFKFPFKLSKTMYLSVQDVERLNKLFRRMPEIQVKGKKDE